MLTLKQQPAECHCDQCKSQRSPDEHVSARHKTGAIPIRNAHAAHRPRPRAGQPRKKILLVDKINSPPKEVIPAHYKVPDALPAKVFPIPQNSEVANAMQYCKCRSNLGQISTND